MPTIAVNKAELYRRLEKEYMTKEFDELCFDFGIELDDDTTAEVEAARKAGLPAGEPQLKIEIPANRYDLLCLEGLARALRIFLEKDRPPTYTLARPAQMHEVYVEASTSPLRPMFAAAVLRLARPLTQLEYDSFIDLQDKLHQNLCRQRKFVAIGTHDLDTIEGPFRYMCKDPKQIKFAPLNKDAEYTAEELMTVYEQDRHLNKYLHLIRDAPGYPIIYDKHDRVLSMPPIINSQHSRIIAGKTQNIFIDTTAIDQTKLDIVIMMVATMFAEYCAVPFEIEPVLLHLPDGTTKITPSVAPRATTASHRYLNEATGLSLSREDQCALLTRMSLAATPSATDADALLVDVPCTRPDILHECDIMEDFAIAYGFNNLPTSLPQTNTVAKPFAVNRLADLLRKEPDPGRYAIALANPKSIEFQVVRTSLLPGMLKTVRENRGLSLPLKVFEVSDVAVQDARAERQARNFRRLCAVYMDNKGGFEVVHGLLDRIMQILDVPFIERKESDKAHGYYIAGADDPTFLPGRAAHVFYRPKPSAHPSESTPTSAPASGPLHTAAAALRAALPGSAAGASDINLGSLGILHPSVLANFELPRPASVLEIDVEPLL